MYRFAIVSSLLALLFAPAVHAYTHQQTVLDCQPNTPTGAAVGSFAFHMKKLGVDDDDGIGDSRFEFRFEPWVRVYAKEPGKGFSQGRIVCAFENDQVENWYENPLVSSFLLGGLREAAVSLEFALENVPKNAYVEFQMELIEVDKGPNDLGDFNADPGPRQLYILMDVANGTAQSRMGIRQGINDIQLNRQKRLKGRGGNGDFVAAADFVVNFHPGPTLKVGKVATVDPLAKKAAQLAKLKEQRCRNYALWAVEMNVAARKVPCTWFTPPVWSNDHESHFTWCMAGNNVVQAPRETLKRGLALKTCVQDAGRNVSFDLCKYYGGSAAGTAGMIRGLGCSVSGPRFLGDAQAHAGWCRSNPPEAVLTAEVSARSDALAKCMSN